MWAEWKVAWTSTRFRIQFTLSILGMIAFVLTLPYFFNEILLPKPGVQLHDPVLLSFQPRDWSTEIFVLLYFAIVLSLSSNLKKPDAILLMLQTYVVVNFLRMISLYLLTLEAPEGTIPLNDPFLNDLAYGKEVYVKDLFFSGHISTVCIFFLVQQKRILKWILLVSIVLMAILLAWQRVHYTLDMVVAPVMTWLVFKFFSWFNVRLKIFPTVHTQ